MLLSLLQTIISSINFKKLYIVNYLSLLYRYILFWITIHICICCIYISSESKYIATSFKWNYIHIGVSLIPICSGQNYYRSIYICE